MAFGSRAARVLEILVLLPVVSWAGTVGCSSHGLGAGGKDGAVDAADTSVADTSVAGTTGAAGAAGDSGAAGADGGAADASSSVDASESDGNVSVPPDAAGTAPEVGGVHFVAGQGFDIAGNGDDSCTNQLPYSTDRWCAFAKAGTFLGSNELWVINATRAAAGVPIKCDTLDASCLRLSTTVLDDPTSHFLGHKFDGDTLIFSEGLNGTPSGDIFAWRPGWTVARKLTSQTGAACVGNKVSTTVLCAQNAQVDATQTKATVEIHAGPVTDANGGALPLLDTFIYATTADAQSDLPRYSFAISPDGGFIAWSGRYEVGGLETLKVQKVGDAASRLTVATGISSWGISPDLTKWFWLKSFNYNGTGTASGSLESAPFPAGTPATPLASNVGDYVWAFSSKWLLFRSNLSPDVGGNGVGTLSFMADHDVPGALAVLDTKVLNVLDVTADGTKVMYSKTQDLLGGTFQVFDLYLAKPDGSPPCTLASTPLVFASPTRPRFLDSGRLAVLGRLNAVTSEGEGLAVNVGACTTTKFAHEIYSWWPVGDEGVVVADDLAAVNGKGEVSLRYALATNATLPATATSIRPHVGTDVAVLLPALPAVMYTIGGTTDAAGLYIDATLPFKTTGPNATRSAPRDLGSAGWPFARSTRFSVRARRP